MKRAELREREDLVRIFYTIIKVNQFFPLTLARGKFQIRIYPTAIPETPLPAYNILFIKNNGMLLISLTISIGNYGNYEVYKFESIEGRKAVKEAIKAMRDETS